VVVAVSTYASAAEQAVVTKLIDGDSPDGTIRQSRSSRNW
jgi:hypothetical protein